MLAKHAPTQHIVEFGILLDLLVGVMIMGIIIHRINHSYDDADTAFPGAAERLIKKLFSPANIPPRSLMP